MAELIPDTLDFSAYLRQTEAKVKVKPASAFRDELLSEFESRNKNLAPAMFSTKLRNLLQFRSGEVTAWAGYNGHRKSMFTGQVALDLCQLRQRVLIASFEMSPQRTLARMARQASGVAAPQAKWIDTFSAWTDGRLWLFDHMGRIDGQKLTAVCRYFAEELEGQHVFIDSMMMVCASEEHLDEQKQFVTDLCRLAKETGLHVHLITHCRKPAAGDDSKPPTKYDIKGSGAISDQAENVVTVWQNKAKRQALDKNPHDPVAMTEPDAAVTVEKQRNAEFEGRLKLWFHEPSLRFTDERESVVAPYELNKPGAPAWWQEREEETA